MKQFLIPSQVIVVGAEFEIYTKLLKDLGIVFKIKDIDVQPKQNITIYQLIEHGGLAVRTANCLSSFINHDKEMRIDDFVRNYSSLEFSRTRNVGPYTLTDLKRALFEIGYNW